MSVAKLSAVVHRHKNGNWSVYLTLPDGSTEAVRGILDVLDVNDHIWQRLREMNRPKP